MLSVLKIIYFYIFSRDSVLKISSMVNLITKQKTLNYIKVASQNFLSEIKFPIFIYLFFSTVLNLIFGVYNHFGFAKVKIPFALYEVRNDNSIPKGHSLKMKKGSWM